jgi:phosphatidylglycerophosphatase A
VAPGTAGSLVGVAAALLAAQGGTWIAAAVTAIVIAAGVWICGEAARRLGVHDHPAIVWDEIAGMMVAMLAAPQGWSWTVLAFALFRLFDIVKPWPIREIDHGIRGGAGIMLDDVLAGILAALGLFLARSIT